MSTAAEVRSAVNAVVPRSFVRARELEGPRAAVESELSRLVARDELVRVRKGLYYRPPPRGRRRPAPLEVGMEVGGAGSGPSGLSAARMFGLTTQVPAVETVAVPGRAPADLDGVRFVSRPYARREAGLNPFEAGLLEVLRDFEGISEEPFGRLAEVATAAVVDGKIRTDRVARAVTGEWDVGTRRRWHELQPHLSLAAR